MLLLVQICELDSSNWCELQTDACAAYTAAMMMISQTNIATRMKTTQQQIVSYEAP